MRANSSVSRHRNHFGKALIFAESRLWRGRTLRRWMAGCGVLMLAWTGALFAAAGDRVDPRLLTVAERSDYRATARYDEVMALCRAIDESAEHVTLTIMGQTVEGRDIPVLILARPPVQAPEEAMRGDRVRVLAFGNIHAGEVCGKEALPMLAREIAADPKHPLLENLIIFFAPILNADGNERVSRDNRPGQIGPEEGMGQRHNAQDLDLNRDFVKLETPEVRSLVRFMNRWDPAMVIDTHTTNGSHHQYTMTYEGPRHAAGDPRIIEFVRERMLPEVGRRLETRTGYRSFFYGNLYDQGATWSTDYGDTPRYSTNCVGMRNRLAVLAEAYAYASYRDRVLCTREFVRELLEYAAENADDIRKLIRDVDAETVARGRSPAPDDLIALRTRQTPYEGKVTVAAYAETRENHAFVSTGMKQNYEAMHVGRSTPTFSVARPFAYLIPASATIIREKLQQHGIAVQELHEDVDLPILAYDVTDVKRADQPFMKHLNILDVGVVSRTQTRRIPAGTLLVRTAQKLGTLAAYLLEPRSEDGLVAWNFFDDDLERRGEFPVLRLDAPVMIEAGPVEPLPIDRSPPRPITFEDYVNGRGPNLRGSPVSGLVWLSDGEHYLQVREGRLMKVRALTGESFPFHDPRKMAEALSKVEGVKEEQARNIAESTRFHMDEARRAALITRDNDLYYAAFDGSLAVRLTRSPDQVEELADFSPDGRYVSFVRNQNLFVVDVATQTERQLTTDGGGLVYNGKNDWVYYEEIFNRSERCYWWSGDSAAICFFRIDDSPVHTFHIVDHQPVRQNVEIMRYPKAGDPNPAIRFGIVRVDATPPVFADLSAYDPEQIVLSGAGFFPGEGAPAYVYVQDRAQTWLDVCTVHRDDGAVKVLFRDKTAAWIESPGDLRFLKDGSFLVTSERTGFKHLYHYAADGTLKTAITSGEWEIRDIDLVDEENGWVYVSGTKDSPIASNLYRIRLDGTGFERLTRTGGHHDVNVSPEGNLYIDTWSSHAAPPQVGLYRTDGTLERMLDTNPVQALQEWRLGSYEIFQITMSDGFRLEAAFVKPPDFDPARKYPVWFMTYAGPHAPTISDSWGGGRVYEQMLANEGFLVFRADPRSASGKGAVSAWTAYKKLGVQEMKDIEEAIAWVASQPFVDPDRIGMSGHSYGGFMTAYALTHSRRFRCGVAGAPVTDWALYDTIYTERYMDTPQNNPSGYAETSVIAAAGNLHGKLLLLHGTMDDNVHMQNTIKLVDALIKANKDFELMLYPGFRHGIGGPHYNRLVMNFMRANLLTPPATPAEPEAAAPHASP